MGTEKNECDAATCTKCACGDPQMYWCDYCNQAYPEKRCPTCGLKLKKLKG